MDFKIAIAKSSHITVLNDDPPPFLLTFFFRFQLDFNTKLCVKLETLWVKVNQQTTLTVGL